MPAARPATPTVHDHAPPRAMAGGRDLAIALLVALIAAVVARLAFTIQLTEDSATYAHQILAPGADFFHPHHLLYNAAVRLLASLAGAVGQGADVWAQVRALQWVNLLVSAAAPGLMYLIARRLAVPPWLAIGLALAFGLAFRFLTFATQVEVYNFALAALTLATLGLVLPERSRLGPWLVALGYFLAMGFHQTALFFGGAVLVMAAGRARPWRWPLVALVLPGAAIGLAYLAIGLSLGHDSPRALWLWLTEYAHRGSWGQGSASLGTVIDALRGFSLAYGQGGGEAIVLVLLLALAALALTTGWQRQAEPRRFVLAMACFFLPLALFNAWWYGRNPEFWIMATLPVTGAIAAMLGAGPPARPALVRPVLAGLVLAQLGLLAWQAAIARKYEGIEAALTEAAATMRPGDVVLTVDTRLLSFLDLQLLGRNVRLEALSLAALDAAQRGVPVEAGLAEFVHERVVNAPPGSRVVLDSAILTAPSTARGLEKLDRARLAELLGRPAAPGGQRFVVLSPTAGSR